jgi:hypothetical protein
MHPPRPQVSTGTFRARPKPETRHYKNALEALSERKVPDVILGLLLALLCAFTLLPYLGGRELWMLGTSTVKIPTISSFALWLSVVATPYLWLFATTRILNAPFPQALIGVIKATILLFLVILLHTLYPGFGLTAVDQTNLLNKQIDAHGLQISRSDIGYSFFRSEPIRLETDEECVLRFESVEISANARGGRQQRTSAFDFQVFASTSDLSAGTLEYHEAPPWKRVSSRRMVDQATVESSIEEPKRKEVAGRAVVKVTSAIASGEDFPVEITYDFKTLDTKVKPESYVKKEVVQADLMVTGKSKAEVQLVGWTLWGEGEVALIVDQPKIKIDGKKFCPPLYGYLHSLKTRALRAWGVEQDATPGDPANHHGRAYPARGPSSSVASSTFMRSPAFDATRVIYFDATGSPASFIDATGSSVLSLTQLASRFPLTYARADE